MGPIELRIPKLRQSSDFPSLLEPRRRAERVLVAVVQEAYVQGVSTRKVDDLVRALGLDGISKSEVSRLCAELDERMERFRNRPLEGECPYIWLDAEPIKVRQDHRVVNMAAVIAVGIQRTGEREVLGLDVVAALVRTNLAQPDLQSARAQLESFAANLDRRFPQAAALLRDAAEDVLAYMSCPTEHWRRIHSTNVLERLNRELARCCDVMGIFPNAAAALRLLRALLKEQ